MSVSRVAASFRDPSGFVFVRDGVLYRQVNQAYAAEWERCAPVMRELIDAGLLIPHHDADLALAPEPGAWKVVRPDAVPFVSYPYEWCFGQLKAAALLTLDLQQRAIQRGVTLRDASAYNVQFIGAKPVFIDTLSLGGWTEGEPWVAYQQFCRQFLAPLALMSYTNVALSQLSRVWMDGVPLDVASGLLPFTTKLRPGLLTHVHLHGAASRRYADAAAPTAAAPKRVGTVGRTAMLGLLDSLRSTVEALTWLPKGTEWGDYYAHTNYTEAAHAAKATLVGRFLDEAKGRAPVATVWDLGANTGKFSQVAAERGARVLSFDVDPAAVELHFRALVARGSTQTLPLLQDLTNPSAGIGWAHRERASLADRGPADVVMALALIHHLAISNNVPLPLIASYFAQLGRFLILEFVPKSDSQVVRLLATREDVFPDYTLDGFERAFSDRFTTLLRAPVEGSERVLFLLERR